MPWIDVYICMLAHSFWYKSSLITNEIEVVKRERRERDKTVYTKLHAYDYQT